MTLHVFCGIPASGKTTMATQLAQEQDAKLYSYDVIRRDSKLSSFQDICSLIYQRIKADLSNGLNVIYDAPNHRLKYRQNVINTISSGPCQKICVVLLTPFDECLKRNANREARLPDFVLHDMHNKFELPTLDEGWDDIWYYK